MIKYTVTEAFLKSEAGGYSVANENDKQKLDDFWNLDKLVPGRPRVSPFATRPVMFEHSISGEDSEEHKKQSDNRLTVAANLSSAVEEEYYPKDRSFIKRVKIKRRGDKYDFYGNFRNAAIVNFDCRSEKCEFVQYYSYLPQYSQLTSSQKSYYFYWRGEVRRGRYIKTDYSYLYLLVYEIINLPDLVPPESGLLQLINLWREYRSSLPRIDFYFSIWVRDYCLVHRLPLPIERLSDFIFDIVAASSFKEFYLSYFSGVGDSGLVSMLAYLSDYDYRRGKFADGNPSADSERRERQRIMYRTHMTGAMSELLKNAADIFNSSGVDGNTAVLRCDAFPNSLCTHTVKCMLEIEYYPIAEAKAERRGITAAVRYAENRMRAIMGVKSRLSVVGLPDSYKEVLDGYFDALERQERKTRERELEPEYERLYYAPSEELSMHSADEIEALSWDTTAKLVVDDMEAEPEAIALKETLTSPCKTDNSYGLDAEDISFIAELLDDNAAICADTGAMIDRINEAFADGFGDIIIEFDDDRYRIIEDYREDVKNWLRTLR